jgi:hypothetical protein
MEKAVGTAFYHNILRDYGRVNQPKLIRDVAIKQKVLQMLESVARGIDRLEAVLKRIDPNTTQGLLTKLQVSSLGQIADIKCKTLCSGSKKSRGQTRPTQLEQTRETASNKSLVLERKCDTRISNDH